MLAAYWRRANERAMRDTRHTLGFETGQRIVRHILAVIVTTVILIILVNHYGRTEDTWFKIVTSAAPILVYFILFFVFYMWNIIVGPAKLNQEAQNTIASLKAQVDLKPVSNVWLYDAICRVYLGKWELIQVERDEGTRHAILKLNSEGYQSIHDLCEKVRQLAFEDRLPIWGKKPGFSKLWEKIEAKSWCQNCIDYQSLSEGNPEKVTAVPLDTSGQIVSFQALMTNRETVDNLCRSGVFSLEERGE